MADRGRDEQFFRDLVYGKFNRERFTQDSPVLLDVYVGFGVESRARLDLLLTPDWSKTPGELAMRLQRSFGISGEVETSEESASDIDQDLEARLAIAFNQSVVAIKLSFMELVRHVLPLSWWWNEWLVPIEGKNPRDLFTDAETVGVATQQLTDGLVYLMAERKRIATLRGAEGDRERTTASPPSHWLFRDDLVWAAHLFYVIEHSTERETSNPADAAATIAGWFVNLVAGIPVQDDDKGRGPWVFSVNQNRPIHLSTRHSIPTTKADVVHRTFEIRGEGIRWAVVDSGIDATHIAFRRHDSSTGQPYDAPFEAGVNHTRIKATYDFSRIRSELSQHQRRALGSKTGRLVDWEHIERQMQHSPHPLRITHDHDYRVPNVSHGTHVAGILAADWDPDAEDDDPVAPPVANTRPHSPIRGMCPDLELYDLRVFEGHTGDEFSVMSALQFVRSLNQRQDTLEVHGVNLSLSVFHDVANFACGSSPVCEESTRLVNNGVVVVAAAGNAGRTVYTSTQGSTETGYRTVSIADPGNAEAVITVGATHRQQPHTYGISYFSSRGPTGDGRMKPDLVAPGEKVYSTIPGGRVERQDGTSQAAPHVSGAAALLMCRHRELIGDPTRVKRILMETATDLGRERAYQGAGLVDVLRAIQRF